MNAVTIDPACYPHIFDSIFHATSRDTRFKLRCVSSALRGYVDARLANHVTLLLTLNKQNGTTQSRICLGPYTSIDKPPPAYKGYEQDELLLPEACAFLHLAKAIDISWCVKIQASTVAAIQQHVPQVQALRLFPGPAMHDICKADREQVRHLFQHLKPELVCLYMDHPTIDPLSALRNELTYMPKPKVVYSFPPLPYAGMQPTGYRLPLVAPACSEIVVVFREPWALPDDFTQGLGEAALCATVVGYLYTIVGTLLTDLPATPLTIVGATRFLSESRFVGGPLDRAHTRDSIFRAEDALKARLLAELGRLPDCPSASWTDDEYTRAIGNLNLLKESQYIDRVGNDTYNLEVCLPTHNSVY